MPNQRKIQPLAAIDGHLARARAEKKTIVQTHGLFDLLHPAAIDHLTHAREQGDLLVVSLPQDVSPAGTRPLFNQRQRAVAVAALACVDYVALANGGLALEAIQVVRPNVYVPWDGDGCSAEQAVRARQAESVLVESLGGRVGLSARPALGTPVFVHHSSPAFPPEAQQALDLLSSRFSPHEALSCLEKARELKVLFVGETIIDEYQYCETIGKSGKEPILAARYLSSEKFAGGILSTANQAAAFCDHVGLVSLLGTQDSHEDFVRQRLSPNIDASFVSMPETRTIVKRRLVEVYPFQKLFEVYFMDAVVPESASAALLNRLRLVLPRYDMVVVTDYGHGMITPDIVDLLCESGRFLAINTQTNAANQGFNTVSKYHRADYICLSERELRLEARNRSTDARQLMEQTAKQLSCPRMLITRGREGCYCYHADEGMFAIPSFTNRIVDRIGAGDALLAVTSLCAVQAIPIELVGFIGNAVGALAVEIVGNRSVVSRDHLLAQVESLLNFNRWFSPERRHS
jgi:bifunctional ADP-heptose synthase (sugar kinase/adenylyltransferase)